MENLKIEVEEDTTYWQRMRRMFFLPFIILTTFILFLYFIPIPNKKATDLQCLILALSFYVPVLIIITLQCDLFCASYIHSIEINEKWVYVIGTKRDKSFELNDSIEKFTFKLCDAPAKSVSNVNYIKITYQGIVVKQSDKWNWKSNKEFDQLWDYLKRRNLLKTGWF